MLKHETITNAYLLRDLTSDHDIFESKEFRFIHRRMVRSLPVIPEVQVPELDASEATREAIVALSKDFTFPIVVRGGLKHSDSVKEWHKRSFWLDKYGDEEVVCTGSDGSNLHTLKDYFTRTNELYVAGATSIFERNPELKEMINNDITARMMPDGLDNPAFFTQMFMGLSSTGTTVHCAIGVNIFRQIAGRKKWYFLPPSQTPYVYPKLYTNGYSATSKTIQDSHKGQLTPWFNKLERYTTTLEPGDLLINPPWWWHAVENFAEDDELVIGCPTRFDSPERAMRVDPFKTQIATWKHLANERGYSNNAGGGLDAALAFENSLIENREETYQSLALK